MTEINASWWPLRQQMFGCEIIHFQRLPLCENINEYNLANECYDSLSRKTPFHRELNIWIFH